MQTRNRVGLLFGLEPVSRALLALLSRLSRYLFLYVLGVVVYVLAAGGLVGQFFGVHNLFLEDAGAQYFSIRNSPAFNSHICLALAVHFCWTVPWFIERSDQSQERSGMLLEYLRQELPTVLGLVLVAWAFIAFRQASIADADLVQAQAMRSAAGVLAGLSASIAIAIAAIMLARWTAVSPLLAHMALFYALIVGALLHPKLIPAVSLFLLLMLLVLIYVVFKLLARAYRPLTAAVAIGAVVLSYRSSEPFQFPGFVRSDGTSYYDAANRVALSEMPDSARNSQGVKPEAALEAWKAAGGSGKVVIVATSGGAYRATFWTAAILDRLIHESRDDGRAPGLSKSVRLLTGASGGMVAAAYFVALAEPGGGDTRRITAAIESDILAVQSDPAATFGTAFPVPRDSLSSVAQQLIQRDLPRLISFGRGGQNDRGRVLEESWRSLHVPFSKLSDGEREGWRPSIILSPAVQETGEQLLISNLDLSGLTTPTRRPFELFRALPDSRNSLRLVTAVRMNATFPYMTPVVVLPTKEPRHLVDAGYFDNYGIATAVAYLRAPAVMSWLKANAAGVMVIQLRAFRDEQSISREHPSWLRCEGIHGDERQPGAFSFLTAPLAAAGAAREASMRIRNEKDLEYVQELYGAGFVRTVAFENTTRSSMSWYVPQNEKECLDSEAISSENNAAFDELAAWWAGRAR